MNLSIGIVGMPNVGKSTLFNALTNGDAHSANFPFATIDPNIRIIDVPDKRLTYLSKLYHSEKVIHASIKVVDIAGLVKGASQGEGLGNKFLSSIRQVDAIAHVIRGFVNDDIIHVEGTVNTLRDVKIINSELILADLEIVESRIQRIKKMAAQKQEDALIEYNALKKIYEALLNEKFAFEVLLDENEIKSIKSLSLITLKPMIYVCNVDESQLNSFYNDKDFQHIVKYAKNTKSQIVPVCALNESELIKLDKTERDEYLSELNIVSSIDEMIKRFYKILNLSSFFTVGKKEARAWKFKNGIDAPNAAGLIHTDIQRGFIKAEVIPYNSIENTDLTLSEIKKLTRIEGKDYMIKDGDIVHFRYNI